MYLWLCRRKTRKYQVLCETIKPLVFFDILRHVISENFRNYPTSHVAWKLIFVYVGRILSGMHLPILLSQRTVKCLLWSTVSLPVTRSMQEGWTFLASCVFKWRYYILLCYAQTRISQIDICHKSALLAYRSVQKSQDFHTSSLFHSRLRSMQENSVLIIPFRFLMCVNLF